MKNILFLIITFLSIASVDAQVASDALKYSYIPQYGGTARAIGVGGAMGALGGDFSAISTNPAGLGTYRASEFTFTPSFHTAKTTSTLLNGGTVDVAQRANSFNVDNLGIVFARHSPNSKWKTLNFAFGYNRFQNFGNTSYYDGTTIGSVTGRWRDQANIEGVDDFESQLAVETGALYKKTLANGSKVWVTDFDKNPAAGVNKNEITQITGSSGEMLLAFGGNYNEKIQIGAEIGIPIIRYSEIKTYRENDKRNEVPYFEKLEYTQNKTTTGQGGLSSGVNAKLGIILKPVQFLRLGLAVHTPTAYALEDRYDSKLTYIYTDSVLVTNEAKSPDGNFKYKLSTPWRVIGSAAVIVGKSGFLSADVEWADYSKMAFNFGKDEIIYQNTVNNDITTAYKSALSVRIGGEYVYDIFRFRAGVGLNGSPRTDKDFYNTTYSAGIGLRGEHFFMDLGWQNRRQKENYIPYKLVETQVNLEQKVTTSYVFNDYLLTLGIRF